MILSQQNFDKGGLSSGSNRSLMCLYHHWIGSVFEKANMVEQNSTGHSRGPAAQRHARQDEVDSKAN
eukprot:6208223-Pleurochrysis_carterae.AAC.3